MANNGMLCKMLFYNITMQARVLAAIASVDASNCYNRIAHAMASMIFQAFSVPTTAIESMLGAIENIKFVFRTGYEDSKTFAGGGISIKMQGLCHNNGASPVGWVVISICILRVHGKRATVQNFSAQLQSCNTIYPPFYTWMILTSCTSTSQKMNG